MGNTTSWDSTLSCKGNSTPWGRAQEVQWITPWCVIVHTASHGGVRVDQEHNKLIPRAFRNKGGWYEEDCEVNIVYFFLANQLKEDVIDSEKEWLDKHLEGNLEEELQKWFPARYREYYFSKC